MRKILIWLSILALVLSLSPAVCAAGSAIVDDADLLTEAQEDSLAEMAKALRQTYDMDVVVHTVWSLGGKTAQAYADDYYDYNGYGVGDDYSGVILVISMEYRDWAISTCGRAVDALSDGEQDSLFGKMSFDLSQGNYYDAFASYMEGLEYYFLDYLESMAPPDAGDYTMLVFISLVVGAIAGFIGLMAMRSSMNTAVAQKNAQSYLVSNSFSLPVNQNTFLYTRTSRTRIQQSSSGGGTSVHRSSSGRSHGGRSGKF